MVLYRVGLLNQLLFRLISTTPYFALPNILGAGLFEGEPVVLERLCHGGEAEDLAPVASALLVPGPARDDALARLGKLKEKILHPGATASAAEALLEFVSSRSARGPATS